MILLLFKCILRIVFKNAILKGIYFFIYKITFEKREILWVLAVFGPAFHNANTGTLQKKGIPSVCRRTESLITNVSEIFRKQK
jgi:hypothetical protein